MQRVNGVKGHHLVASQHLQAGSFIIQVRDGSPAGQGAAVCHCTVAQHRAPLMQSLSLTPGCSEQQRVGLQQVCDPELVQQLFKRAWCAAVHYCSSRCAGMDLTVHHNSGECWLMQQEEASSAALGALFREGALALRYCHIGELRPPLESHTKHVLGSLSQSAGRGPVHHLLRVLAQAHVEGKMEQQKQRQQLELDESSKRAQQGPPDEHHHTEEAAELPSDGNDNNATATAAASIANPPSTLAPVSPPPPPPPSSHPASPPVLSTTSAMEPSPSHEHPLSTHPHPPAMPDPVRLDQGTDPPSPHPPSPHPPSPHPPSPHPPSPARSPPGEADSPARSPPGEAEAEAESVRLDREWQELQERLGDCFCQVVVNALEVAAVHGDRSAVLPRHAAAASGAAAAAAAAVQRVAGGQAAVRLLHAAAVGQELTISYTDLMRPVGERRAELQQRYSFTLPSAGPLESAESAAHLSVVDPGSETETHLAAILTHGSEQLFKQGDVSAALTTLSAALQPSPPCPTAPRQQTRRSEHDLLPKAAQQHQASHPQHVHQALAQGQASRQPHTSRNHDRSSGGGGGGGGGGQPCDVHHHLRLDAYALAATCCRIAARRSATAAPAAAAAAAAAKREGHWRSALSYSLMCASAAEEQLARGEHGLIPHAAACWSELSSTACDALSALIASHPARGTSHGSSSIPAPCSMAAAANSPTQSGHSGACAAPSHSRPAHGGPDESRPKRQRTAHAATHAGSQLQACESLQSTQQQQQQQQQSVPLQREPNQQRQQHLQLVRQSEGSGPGNLGTSQPQQSETQTLSPTPPPAELPSADMTGKSVTASKVLLGAVARFMELSRSVSESDVGAVTAAAAAAATAAATTAATTAAATVAAATAAAGATAAAVALQQFLVDAVPHLLARAQGLQPLTSITDNPLALDSVLDSEVVLDEVRDTPAPKKRAGSSAMQGSDEEGEEEGSMVEHAGSSDAQTIREQGQLILQQVEKLKGLTGEVSGMPAMRELVDQLLRQQSVAENKANCFAEDMRLLKEKYNSASGALTATQEALTLSNKQLLIVKEKLAIATRIHIPVPGEDYVDSTAAAFQPNQMRTTPTPLPPPSPSPFPFPCPTFLQHSSKPTPFPPSLPSLHHSSPTSSHLTPQEPQDLSYKQREHKKGQQQDAVQAWANGRIVSWRGGRLVTKEKDSTAPFKLYTRPGQSAGPATDLHVDGAAESPSAVAAAAAATAALVGTPAADSMEAQLSSAPAAPMRGISVFVRDHLSNAVSISSRNLSSGIMVVRLAASLLPTLDSHAHLICCYFTPTPGWMQLTRSTRSQLYSAPLDLALTCLLWATSTLALPSCRTPPNTQTVTSSPVLGRSLGTGPGLPLPLPATTWTPKPTRTATAVCSSAKGTASPS
ncbi:MAG: hypothetical protein WDW38_007229 [Sanguina aurantia]